MRLAIIGDELDQDLARVVNAVQTNQFQGIEVRSVWNTQPDKLTKEQLTEIRTTIEKAGLAVAGFDSPGFKIALPRTDAELEAAQTSILQAIEQARLLDAGFVRIFTFYREGEANPVLAGQAAKRVLEGIIPEDIDIYIETGMRTNTPTMQHMLKFLDVIGDNRLGVVWDPGNSVFAGADSRPFPADYEAGRELIKHVHIKDPKGQQEYVRVGDGDLPWLDIVRRLNEDNYAGWLSLETHWRIGRVLNQEQRDNPWFETFSAGGYEASVQCMQQMLSYMREVK